MPAVAILGFNDSYASALAGFADMLQVANAHISSQGDASAGLFEWHFLSHNGLSVRASNGLEFAMQPLPKNRSFDLIFIPPLRYRGWLPFQKFLESQAVLRAWLVQQWQHGAWLCANCTGTFLLADTGLLDNKVATTTWWLEGHFRERFSLIDLQMRPVVTEVDRLVCGGAYAAFLPQAVHMLDKFAGRPVAMQCARSMLIDVTQTTHMLRELLTADQTHNDSLIHRAQKWLQDHFAETVRVDHLARRLAVSERTLTRRFNRALQQSPLTYLQNLRIERARALLEAGDLSTECIAHYVGYNDMSSFARLFRKRIGLAPGAYRAQFHLPNSN